VCQKDRHVEANLGEIQVRRYPLEVTMKIWSTHKGAMTGTVSVCADTLNCCG